MKILKSLSRQDFQGRFSSNELCFQYLAEIKWFDGFECKKCSTYTFCKGKQYHSRRCTRCKYDESPTAGTLFHKIKFPLKTAFEMLYEITTSKKGANSIWLAERFGVQQKTAWLFRQKVQRAMSSSGDFPLEEEVHVDEFEIGTPKEAQQGRSYSEEKVRVVIALEHRNGKAGRGYAKVIDDYSTHSLKKIFDEHIDYQANVVTDGWTGYMPLVTEYPNLQQKISDKGRNFKMLHIQIRNLKNWLRGVHSYCNKTYLECYLQEYFYRFNRRNSRTTILENILERMIFSEPISYFQIKFSAT